MSTRTAESIAEEASFTELLRAVPGLRARVTLDAEGWPEVRGLYGRLEWRGVPLGDSPRVYAYTDRNRILSKITAVPGTRPCQAGDDEGVVSMVAEDHAAILACARLLRCHTDGRGRSSKGRSAEDLAALRPAAVSARRSPRNQQPLVVEPEPYEERL